MDRPWSEVYDLWKSEARLFPDDLSAPLEIEDVFVAHEDKGIYFYGFDWLDSRKVSARKQIAKTNPIQFLYFITPSNKGTILTAQMLAESLDEEERAAIWIAATSYELMNGFWCHENPTAHKFAREFYYSALEFLNTRFFTWHHAMRKLVPEIMVPYEMLESIDCKNEHVFMNVVQTNTVLLKGGYKLMKYHSDNDPEHTDSIRYA